MIELLVGFVVDYDTQEGKARVRVRSRLLPGDLVHIAGVRTDREVKLKAPRIRADLGPHGEDGEIDVFIPTVEAGDMVFRVVKAPAAHAQAVA